MNILFICERSAGHIFPALCFAKKIVRDKNFTGDKPKIYFFSSSLQLNKYIEKEGFMAIGKSFTSRILIIEMVWRAFEAIYIILSIRPKKVIGFGGRDSIFLVLLSRFLSIETSIYEPNIIFGKANKLLSFFVKKVLVGMYNGSNKKFKTVGIPLRENIKRMDKTLARKKLGFGDKPVILCLGGSQGSIFINNTFLKFIKSEANDYQIIHLTGEREYDVISAAYKEIKNNSIIKDFYYNMEDYYSAADIIISRAGANTLAEIAYYKLPSILIPYPQAGRHQRENAFYFSKKGAALVYLQDDFLFDLFKKELSNLLANFQLRNKMIDNLEKINIGVSFESFVQIKY